jgi:hypothetical protein
LLFFDSRVKINGPQDLPFTFMIYVPKKVKPQRTCRERNRMAVTTKMSFCPVSYLWNARERTTNSAQLDV